MRRMMLLAIVALMAGVALSGVRQAAANEPSAGGMTATTSVAAQPISGEIPVTAKSEEAIQAFKKGREYAEDIRTPEATAEFKKATELDPTFALAHAYLGEATPGKDGLQLLEQAATLSKDLPEAERMQISIMLADRKGEEEQARSLRRQLAALAPGDWRAQSQLGVQLYGERKWAEAVAALKRAADLNPSAGSVHNMLGYCSLEMGKNDDAVEAFVKYAALRPGEPNPQDSLAEALMAAGRYEESEAAFRKAAEMSPNFWIAWEGVAQSRFLRGDWAGGREALAKAKEAAPRPIDKLDADLTLAWSFAAEGNYAAALKTIDAVEKSAEAQKVESIQAFAPLDRAILLKETGKYEEALAQIEKGLAKAEKSSLPGSTMNGVRRTALSARIDAESKLGRAADAKKTLALLEEESKKAPGNADLQSSVYQGRGAEAMARGDAKAAVGQYAKCYDDDFYCRLELVRAQEKVGDAAGAEASRSALLAANRRGALYLWVRSQLAEKAEATAR